MGFGFPAREAAGHAFYTNSGEVQKALSVSHLKSAARLHHLEVKILDVIQQALG